ncbi:MAG: c-type cytochrome [Candidatus Brocadiales bacterium]
MKTFLSLVVLVLAFSGIFVYIGNTVPQIKPDVTGAITITETPEGLLEAGETLFTKENACLTCHSLGPDAKARCPDQEAVGTRAVWKITNQSMAEYLMESVYIPIAYTVEGYPEGQMKPVNGPPMAFNDDEILAVVSFLYSKGAELDEKAIVELKAAQEKYRKAAPPVAASTFEIPESANAEDGFDVFEEMKCWQCHVGVPGFEHLAGEEGKVGPDIAKLAAMQDAQYMYESIVFPNKIIVKGEGFTGPEGNSKMPEFHDTMTIRQLYDLVAFLNTLK